MNYSSFLVALSWLLVSAILSAPAKSQEPDRVGEDRSPARKEHVAPAESPMSIFNERLRQFKFLLAHNVATPETAEAFMNRYNRPDNPPIIGAYADAETNSLLVVGPPEAEQAIRENLASWIVESQGIAAARPLPMQLRRLRHERRDLLRRMAEAELEQAEPSLAENEQLASRLEALKAELQIVEKQIGVVRKYVERLHQDVP